MEYLCVLSRNRISELSKSELSLQNIKWFLKLLSHQFSLQEMGLRLCHELPPLPSPLRVLKDLGLEKEMVAAFSSSNFGAVCGFLPLGPVCRVVSGSVADQRCLVLPAGVGYFPASTAVAPGEVQLCGWDISCHLCSLVLSCSHPWSSVCELAGSKGAKPKAHKGLV